MNDKNFEYLSKQLLYTGFGDSLQAPLKAAMEKSEALFTLPHVPEFDKERSAVTLHFKKSETQDNYFFNRFSVQVKTPEYPDAIRQTFYLNSGQDNITLKEAYNLLMGRGVQKEMTPKEGEKYQAWLQLDFKNTEPNGNYKIKQFHQNYGYDLEKVLGQRPIKEMEQPDSKQRLMDSLQRGNRQQVSFTAEGREVKIFIEASPQFKSLNYYGDNAKRLDAQAIDKLLAPEGARQQASKQLSPAGESEEAPTQKKSSRKKKGVSM